jgi:hypothetical protein
MRESLTSKHAAPPENLSEGIPPVAEKPVIATRDESSTPEKFRQDIDRLDSAEDVDPEEKEKTYKKLIDNINDLQRELVRNAATEESNIKSVRAKLGLSEDSTLDTHAMRAGATEAEELKDLRTQAEMGLNGEKNFQELEVREKTIRKEAAVMRESIGQLSSELTSRANNGFTPLIEPRDFAHIRTAGAGLEHISGSKVPIDPQELASVLNYLNTGLDGMGRADRSRGIRDNEQSLGRLQSIGQTLRESIQNMSTQFTEGNEDSSQVAQKLMNKLDEFTSFTGRLRAAAKNYSHT